MAAIMVGDFVGYTAMMERAEEQTAQRLSAYQALIAEKVNLLDGRIFNTAGDAAFAEFPSAVNAIRSAFEIRTSLAGLQSKESEPLCMRFGLHVADVVVQGDDLIGDGVNLASRIQAAAEADSIYVSGAMFEQVRRNSAFIFDNVGERTLKNISEPVLLYRVREEIGKHRLQSAPTQVQARKERRPSSLVVLPFRVSGTDEDLRYLAEGLAEELIVEFGRFHRLSVVSQSASFAVADLHPDPVRIGELLGVQFVLRGQVRRAGTGGISISLTLSETQHGEVVWSGKLHREDILTLADEIAAIIAATVSGRLEHLAIQAARRKPAENMTAFDCLLRGLDSHRLGGVTEDYARDAFGWFSRAIEADPNYAAAYAWRVCAGSYLPNFDFEQGRRDIRKALELDPHDAEANRIMGALELMQGNHAEALAHNCKAMELNPSDAYIKAGCASVFTFVGEPERALRLLDEAEALDPFLPVYCIEERGVALYALGDFAGTLESLGKLPFQTNKSRLYRAAALIALDRQEEASRIVKEAIASKPNLTASSFTSREFYSDSGVVSELFSRLVAAGLVP